MNYHIIPQDKFFESYIEDIYRIHQEENNTIWVRGVKGESPYFHTDRPVEYLGTEITVYREHFQRIKTEDKLFICWYDSFIGKLVLQTEVSAALYVYLMGADFYSQPMGWHDKWLFDPITKRKVKKERFYPVFFPIRKPWRWYRWFGYNKRLIQQYKEKLETIKRIDYLVLPEHSIEEINLVKKLYPGFKAQHRVGTFDQNFDLSTNLPMKNAPSEGEPIKIILGNSSDPSGNQLDAIHYLKKSLSAPYDVFCLLSYGDLEVRQWICDYGEKELAENFHVVTDFFNKDGFVAFLNDADVVVMYHNRQQAAGTIMTALTLGKPVFIKAQSPIYDLLVRLGVKSIYDVSVLSTVSLREAIIEAQANREDTVKRIAYEYSTESRLKHLNDLLK